MPIKDIAGQRFGRYTVLNLAFTRRGQAYWLCLCDCGNEKDVGAATLGRPNVSCGCYRREAVRARFTKHGLANSPEYYAWQAIHQRCENTANPSYENYGGRGITVCERWASFGNFIADMGRRPSDRYSLERLRNEAGYSPENCIWATEEEQHNNKRVNRRLRFDGRIQTLTQWARERGMNPDTLNSRLIDGWSTADALTIPVGRSIARRLHARK